MSTDERASKEFVAMEKAANELMEWFDSVVITATRVSDDETGLTEYWYKEKGNSFANMGAALNYLIMSGKTIEETDNDDEA